MEEIDRNKLFDVTLEKSWICLVILWFYHGSRFRSFPERKKHANSIWKAVCHTEHDRVKWT